MKLTVLGAGCWGSALAWLLGDNFEEITIWGRKEDLSEEFLKTKKLTKPLEVQLPQKVQITSDLKEAIKDAKIILMVISTSGIRAVSRQLKEAGVSPIKFSSTPQKALKQTLSKE
jgi:glycerol-3-phosphate dehydrogenase (NAD(P)+)